MANRTIDKIELRIDCSKKRILDLGKSVVNDYDLLNNRPQINGITLSGNKTMTELLADGLIIDGGDSTDVS